MTGAGSETLRRIVRESERAWLTATEEGPLVDSSGAGGGGAPPYVVSGGGGGVEEEEEEEEEEGGGGWGCDKDGTLAEAEDRAARGEAQAQERGAAGDLGAVAFLAGGMDAPRRCDFGLLAAGSAKAPAGSACKARSSLLSAPALARLRSPPPAAR